MRASRRTAWTLLLGLVSLIAIVGTTALLLLIAGYDVPRALGALWT